MKLSTLINCAPALYSTKLSYEFVSGPGIGKSTAIRDATCRLSLVLKRPVGFEAKILSGIESVDVKGMAFPVADKETGMVKTRLAMPLVLPDNTTIEVFENGELVTDPARLAAIGMPDDGILLLDEFGQADTDTQKVSAELLLSRRIGRYRMPGNWVAWAASNRVSDKSGVVKRLAFVDNRQATYPIDPWFEDFQDWCVRNHVHPLATTFAARNPSIVFRDAVPVTGGKFCSPRALVLATKTLEALRPEGMSISHLPTDDLARETIVAWMGAGDGAAYFEHLAVGHQLPTSEEVIDNPTGIKIPDRVDARFILLCNLSLWLKSYEGSLTKGTDRIAAAMSFVSRLDRELQVMFVKSIIKTPKMMASPAFGEWAKKHGELLRVAHAI